jgi:photosystem II stability/assembly factor-like uncharacterized protein
MRCLTEDEGVNDGDRTSSLWSLMEAKSWRLRAAIFVVAVFVFAALPAWGATIALPSTGQTTCYDTSGNVIACAGTGQDGDIQAGVAWPVPRFIDNGDQTITDNLTGLIWQKDGSTPTVGSCTGGAMTWQSALDYVACMNANNYLGHNDWRLPNRIELESLVHDGQPDQASWLNAQGFVNTQGFFYWSSTTAALNPVVAWCVYFGGIGGGSLNKNNNYLYVRCVRGGQSGSLANSTISFPKTGQASCYDSSGNVIACTGTGQDGELQAGVVWPNPRFTANGDQTITDNLTGLIWQKDGSTPTVGSCTGGTITWQSALDYVTCLNANNYLGHNDWRLPNRIELESLVHDGQPDQASWLNAQGFTNTQGSYYWSSTTYAVYTGNPPYAWGVAFDDGSVGDLGKEVYLYVRCVRGGQSGSLGNFVLTVSKTGTGSGTVAPDSGTIVWSGASGTATYASGTIVNLTATADTGSTFTGWSGDCNSSGQVTMDSNKSCTATFILNQYTVTPSAGTGGTISPNTAQTINYNATTSFTITPNAGYSIASVTGCGGTLSGNTYTTGPIISDCTVTATFAANAATQTVTPIAIGSGSISPSSSQAVNDDASTSFTMTPSENYFLASILGTCGGTLSGDTFTTSPVTTDCTVKANFATVNEWVNLGPEGGHFTSLALSPNYSIDQTIFAGSFNFGVPRRSTDGGSTWTEIYNGFQREQPITMAVSPNYASDNVVFAGTWAQGIFKSEDHGESWVQSGIPGDTVSSIAVSPDYASDQTLFAGDSSAGGVYISNDGGRTWSQALPGISIYSVALSPNYPGDHTVFASSGGCNISLSPNYVTDSTVFGCGTIYKSIDGGATWSRTNAGAFGKSTDRGTTWSQLSINPHSVALSPNFAVDGTVFAGTWDGELYKSTDGGLSWVQVFSSTSNSVDFSGIQAIVISNGFAVDNTAFVATISHGIFKSTNGGLSWAHLDISNTTVGNIAFSPDFLSDKTMFATGDVGSGAPFISTDGAITWHLSNTGIVGTQLIKSIGVSPNFTTDSTVFLGDHDGRIYRSVDKGATWSNVYTIPNSVVGSGDTHVAVSPGYSTDGTVFAGSFNGIYRSTDQGVTWSLSGLSGMSLTSVAVSPNYAQDRTIFAGTKTGLYKSTDGGSNWTSCGFTGNIVVDLALSPAYASDQTILVGTGAEIYKSTDGGLSWTQIVAGTHIAISPNYAADGTVFSSSWNSGVYESVDRGASWTLIGDLPHVMRLALPPDFASDQRIFAGTSGDGVYSYTIASAPTGKLFIWWNDSSTSFAVNFEATGSACPNGGCTYTWDFGDGATGSGQVLSHAYANGNPVVVTLTVSNGGSNSQTVTPIAAHTAPVCGATNPPTAGTVGSPITFTDSSTRTEASLYINWGDGSAMSVGAIDSALSHSYANVGTYLVTQIVQDSMGYNCTKKYAVKIGKAGAPVGSGTLTIRTDAEIPASYYIKKPNDFGDVMTKASGSFSTGSVTVPLASGDYSVYLYFGGGHSCAWTQGEAVTVTNGGDTLLNLTGCK